MTCLVFLLLVGNGDPVGAVEKTNIVGYSAGLDTLVVLWQDIRDLHEYLRDLQPIALVVGDSMVIFEPDAAGTAYQYRSTESTPFPMSSGIRAAFPLQAMGGRSACVVGEGVFASEEELILVLHEFVHCSQANTVEFEIKATLPIATRAAEAGDFMWEIQHPFPYTDSLFVEHYSAMIASFRAGHAEQALVERAMLRDHLSAIDLQYLVWEEWKEGLARYLENLIRAERGVPVNRYGGEPPYDRIVFYVGGSEYIAYLLGENPGLGADPKALFNAIYSGD